MLAVNTLFPSDVQPYYGNFNALALRHLAANACVEILAPVKWFPGLSLISGAERKLDQIPRESLYHGIPVRRPRFIRTPGFGRRWHGWMYERSITSALEERIAAFKPDVLLASWAHPDGFAVQRIGSRLKIPVVIKCLGSDIHQLIHDRARRAQVLDALHGCQRIVTVSNNLRRMLISEEIDARKIDVVYNGVDRDVFQPLFRAQARSALQQPAHGKTLLCIANMVPIKHHSDLLRALHALLQRKPLDIRLVLLGAGPLRSQLEELARELRISAHVHFAGSCRHDQVPQWIAAADCVCLASGNEGLPNVLVESLACGRPVVATRVGGIPELVTSNDYGSLVEPGDIATLSASIENTLSKEWNPALLSACPNVISWEQSAVDLHRALERAQCS